MYTLMGERKGTLHNSTLGNIIKATYYMLPRWALSRLVIKE